MMFPWKRCVLLLRSVENIRIGMGGFVFCYFFPTWEFLLFWLSIRNGADILSQFLLSLPWPPCKENKRDPTKPPFPFDWVLSGKAVSQSPSLNADLSGFPALMQFFPAYLWQVEEEAHQPPLDDLPAFLCKEAKMEAHPWGTKCLFPLQFHDAFFCSGLAWFMIFFAIWFISLVILYCFKSARGHLWLSLFFNTNYKSKSWECHLKVRDEREV